MSNEQREMSNNGGMLFTFSLSEQNAIMFA